MAATINHDRSADLAARSVIPAVTIIFTVLVMIAVAIIWSAHRTDRNGLALERRIAVSVADIALDHFDSAFRRARWSGRPLREALPALIRNNDNRHAFDVVGLLEAGETEPDIIATREPGDSQIREIARQTIASGLRRQAGRRSRHACRREPICSPAAMSYC